MYKLEDNGWGLNNGGLFGGGSSLVSKANSPWSSIADTNIFAPEREVQDTPDWQAPAMPTAPTATLPSLDTPFTADPAPAPAPAPTAPAPQTAPVVQAPSLPASNPASDVWGGYTAPAFTTPTTTQAPAPVQAPATSVATTPAPTTAPAGANFTSYVQSNPDLLNFWTTNQQTPNAFDYWGLGSNPTIDQFGSSHFTKNGSGEGRVVPTNPLTPPTPQGPTKVDQASGLLDQIKALYSEAQNWNGGSSLDQLKIKQTERDNLLRQLDALGDTNSSALGKTYGGFLDARFNDVTKQRESATKFFSDFMSNFGGDAWAQAKNLPLSTNWQLLQDKLDAADDNFDKYAWSDQYGDAVSARDKLLSTIQGQITAQNAEKSRNADWEKGINSRLDQYVAELEAMDVAGFDSNSSTYRQKMREIENEMRGYNTSLNVDLTDEIRKLSGAATSYSGLQTKRDTEVAKLQDTLTKYAGQGDALSAALSSASAYDGSALAQLEQQIQALKSNAASMNSPLLSKYGNIDLASRFTELDPKLANLREQRTNLLGRESAKVEDIRSRLNGLQDWDEEGMNFLLNMLSGQGQSLARFTGSDTAPLSQALDEIGRGLTTKRGNLTTKRSSIEQSLIAMLDRMRGSKFATLDEVSAARGGLSGDMSDVRKYKATQAQDELDALLALFNGEEARINTDLKVSQARDAEQARATKAQVNRWGNLTANNVTPDVLTADQIATLARKRQVSSGLAPYATPSYSSFSVALGL